MKEELQAVVFFSLLLAASISDLRRRIIPDSINLGIVLTALLCFSPVKILGVFAALPFLVAALKGGMGGGDVKLVAASGLVLGFYKTLFGCVTGLCILFIFAAGGVSIWRHRRAYPMAPFLMAGFLAGYLV